MCARCAWTRTTTRATIEMNGLVKQSLGVDCKNGPTQKGFAGSGSFEQPGERGTYGGSQDLRCGPRTGAFFFFCFFVGKPLRWRRCASLTRITTRGSDAVTACHAWSCALFEKRLYCLLLTNALFLVGAPRFRCTMVSGGGENSKSRTFFFFFFSNRVASPLRVPVDGQDGEIVFNETCPGFLFTEGGEEVLQCHAVVFQCLTSFLSPSRLSCSPRTRRCPTMGPSKRRSSQR